LVHGNTARPYGLNLRGLKRRGFSAAAIETLKRAYKLLYRSGLTLEAAIEQMQPLAREQAAVAELLAFVQRAERGIIR
jgi:UDP-N-acetylglucosamine acyltransferase